jgi:hypothetical protein
MSEINRQEAPYPHVLADLVSKLKYRSGWSVNLVDMPRDRDQEGKVLARGLTLRITTVGYDTYHPERGETYRVAHFMPVPAATYNRQSWMMWLLQQFIKVEQHEACEFFQIDGKRPYAPHHGPGFDPYMIFVHGDDVDARTMYTGKVRSKLPEAS